MVKQFFTKIQPITLKQKTITAITFIVLLLTTPIILLHITDKPNPPIKKLVAAAHITISPTPEPTKIIATPTITVTIQKYVSSTLTPTIKQTINTITQVTANPTTQRNTNAVVIAAAAQLSPTPLPQSTITPMSQPTKTIETVTVQIIEPDGTSNFQVMLHSGNTVCDILQTAKSEEKIKSLTLDNSYMDSLHSAYVKELNGYKDNWTFTINGTSPLGCSLASPKPNDNIIWKFN